MFHTGLTPVCQRHLLAVMKLSAVFKELLVVMWNSLPELVALLCVFTIVPKICVLGLSGLYFKGCFYEACIVYKTCSC